MKIAIVAAGFTPSEADRLRRAMATFRRVGTIQTFQDKMVEGMAAKGYDRDFAERCFRQIEGFGEYGFPESHAASFALLVYASCWMKCRYPDVFAAAMLNSQPLGFYAPAAARARRARAWRRGARGRRQPVGLGLHAGGLSPLPRGRGSGVKRRMRGGADLSERTAQPSSGAARHLLPRAGRRDPPPPCLDGRAISARPTRCGWA